MTAARSRVMRLFVAGALNIGSAEAYAGDASRTAQSGRSPNHVHKQTVVEDEGNALSLTVTYSADAWGAVSGGSRRGARYLDNLDLVVEADLQKLVGWHGASAFVYGLYNNGRSLSSLMGDAQVASNIETGVQAARLYEAWIEQKLGERASVRIGLYDLNSEFDVLETADVFLGSAHGIGTDISQSGRNGPSIFPVTSLAARFAFNPDDAWTLRGAILDGVPGDPARPKRTAIRLGNGDGALLIGELERRFDHGKLIVGHWRYTAPADRNDGGRATGNHGFYVRGEMRLVNEEQDGGQGLAAFFRFGLANGDFNQFHRFASGGLSYIGPVPGRDEDRLGLAFATAIASPSFRRLAPTKRSETAIELTYRALVTPNLTVQPDVQYVISPGAETRTRNALAIGLRVEASFGF